MIIYKSWFINFDNYNNKCPSNWHTGTIEEISKEIICGKTPPTKETKFYGEDIPFITIPDMHQNIYIVKTERYLSRLGAESQKKKILPKDSICVSCIGTAGIVSLVAESSQTNQQINSIIPKNGYSPFYIYLTMKMLSETINKLGQSGSTIINLNLCYYSMVT